MPDMAPDQGIVDRICREVVTRQRTLDADEGGDLALRMDLLGEISGLRLALCHLHGWDPAIDAEKEGRADQLVLDWWRRTHPDEWAATPVLP
jgi:hypothetical protein